MSHAQQVLSDRQIDEILRHQRRQANRPTAASGSIWTPGGPVKASSVDTGELVEILDSERVEIAKIMDWHLHRLNARREVDEHVKDLHERFDRIGFIVDVQVWTVGMDPGNGGPVEPIPGRYEYKIEILARKSTNPFDPEKMHHEVTTNLLDLPGQHDNAIKADRGMMRDLANLDTGGDGHHH